MTMQHVKVLSANAASWLATLISVKLIEDTLRIVALLASIAVSLASLWWVRRQARALDAKNKQ